MTNEEAIEQLLYMKRGVKADSEQDETLDLAISALSRDRWISVDEPPEHGKKYMVCAIGTYYGVKIVESARFSNVWGWMTYEGEPMEAEVTHYRPLPEPPKEET